VSSKGGAVRQPASDLTAFDVSKRSPDDIARLFARWKEQRKSLQATRTDARAAADTQRPRPRLMPVLGRDAAVAEEAVDPPPTTGRSVRYSAPFAAVLETGASGALADRLDNLTFAAAQRSRAAHLGPSTVGPDERSALSRAKRRSRSRWILAGAASILAVAAASGAALWTPSLRNGSNETPASVRTEAPILAPTRNVATTKEIAAPAPRPPIAVRMAGHLLPDATRFPVAAPSPLKAAIDAGLMRPQAPERAVQQFRLAPKLKPRIAEVQTASKTPAEQSREPIAASGMEIEPEVFAPGRPVSRSPSAVSVAIPAALTPQSGAEDEADPGTRPEALYRRGNDKGLIGEGGRGTRGQHGANGSRPSPGGGSGRQGADSAGSAGGGASSGSSGTGGDPSSGTGGSTGAGGSDAGGGTTGSGDSGSTSSGTGGTGGTDAGSGSGTGATGSGGDSGSGGSGSTSGGGTGGATGAGDAGGSAGGDTGGATGGGATGGGDTGGGTGSGSGDGGSSDGGSSDTGSSDTGSSDGGSSDGGSSDGGSSDSGSSGSGGLSGHADVDVGGGGISGSVGGSVGGIGGSVGGSIGGGGGRIGGGLKL
jgi:hypothetical protein